MINKFISTITTSKERIYTGFALVLSITSILYLHNIYLIWAITGFLYLISLYETLQLLQIKELILMELIGSVIWGGTLYIWEIFDLLILTTLFLASILAYNQKIEYKTFFPIIYPTVPFIYIFKLYDVFGINSLIWMILIVALCDTSAYFVGKNIGKRKFSITSPNKTLEGVIGGIVISTMVGSMYAIFYLNFNPFLSILISILVAKSSIFGDLFESYLKRKFNVKDSGKILPGHGGVLDRVDGYLFATIVMYISSKALL